MSRELTQDEVKARFLDYVRSMVLYWHEQESQSEIDKLSGLAFSILSAIDGCSELPAFELIPSPHESDKGHAIEHYEDYYPDNGDIAGSLHEEFYTEQFKEDLKRHKKSR